MMNRKQNKKIIYANSKYRLDLKLIFCFCISFYYEIILFIFSRIIGMENEKEFITTKITDALKNHVKTMEEAKVFFEVFIFYLLMVKVVSLGCLFKFK